MTLLRPSRRTALITASARARSAALVSLVLLLSVLRVAPSLHAQDNEDRRPPNVVLIMTDDQGYGDVGFHGNTVVKTPHLDQLAKESFEMTNFHVDPTCSETRSALMTGRYSCRTGVWHTIMGRSILRGDEHTMADVFARSDYATGIFGKWHLGDNFPYRPQDRGFQEVLIHGGGGVGQTPDYWGNDYFDDTYFHNGKPVQQSGYCTDVFFDHALQFITDNKSRPFFCYIPTNAAHGPFNVDPKYSQPYVNQGVPQARANFYGMIENIDENVDRLRKHLAGLDLDRDTILIFMTDNGTAAGDFTAGLQGRKGSQYEGGHRVPFLVHWPGRNLNRGQKSDYLAAHFDLLPTLIDLCGLQAPPVEFDGISLRNVWFPPLNDPGVPADRTLVVHSQRIEHPEKWRKCSVMTSQWRLIDGEKLYDIQKDLGQTKDLAANHPDVVRTLRAEYERWWNSVSKRFDEYVRIPLGHSGANPTTLTAHDWHGQRVPWNQGHIRSDMKANGFWAVSVAEPGEYEFELRARPEGVDYEFQKGQAGVEVGNASQIEPIAAGSKVVRITLNLSAGDAELRTRISEDQRGGRGAYYVTVRRVSDDQASPAEGEEGASPGEGAAIELDGGDRVLLLGGTMVERMQSFNYFETALFAAHPGVPLVVRNLGWSGDTVGGVSRALFGSEEEGFQRLLKDVQLVEPTVILVAYGGNEAHAGEAGAAEFQQKLDRLLDSLEEVTDARLALITPRPYEAINPLYPDPAPYNEKLEHYTDILKQTARQRDLPLIDLHGDHVSGLTHNGVHLTQYGYWHLAPRLLRLAGIATDPWEVSIRLQGERPVYRASNTALSAVEASPQGVSFQAKDRYLPPSPVPSTSPRDTPQDVSQPAGRLQIAGLALGRYELRIDGEPVVTAAADQWAQGVALPRRGGSEQVEQLRMTVRRKNELFFHRYRPQNETYLFLFRKHEQGNNAVEIPQFDPLVEQLDQQITKLSRPGTHQYSIVRIED